MGGLCRKVSTGTWVMGSQFSAVTQGCHSRCPSDQGLVWHEEGGMLESMELKLRSLYRNWAMTTTWGERGSSTDSNEPTRSAPGISCPRWPVRHSLQQSDPSPKLPLSSPLHLIDCTREGQETHLAAPQIFLDLPELSYWEGLPLALLYCK